MKTNKLIKWLYAVFMFVPFLAVGVRSLYVTFNKNAKDSYYGETINEVEYNDVTELEQPNTYRFVNDNSLNTVDTNGSISFSFNKIKDYQMTGSYTLSAFNYSDYQYCILYFNNGNRVLGFVGVDSADTKYIQTRYVDYIDFENFNTARFDIFEPYLKVPEYNKNSYLDNAFNYSINEFNDVGFNQLDFVSWFSFLYENPNLYTTFLNCYLNYMLFVSIAFFIPRVLYWFVNYAYSLTESFSSKSNGGGW